MQDNPNSGNSPVQSDDDEVGRRVLLELVVDPPDDGDDLIELAERLEAAPEAVAAAVLDLEVYGLAHVRGTAVFASRSALRFDALWPIRPGR